MPMTRLALRCMTSIYPSYIIARTLHVSPAHLSQCMSGKRTLSPILLMDLSYLLACEPEQLVGWAHEDTTLSAELPCIDAGLDATCF